jgi:hypothetical protein
MLVADQKPVCTDGTEAIKTIAKVLEWIEP